MCSLSTLVAERLTNYRPGGSRGAVPCLVCFARPCANMPIIRDHYPSAGGRDRNPVRVVLRHDLDRWSTSANDDVASQPHERDPEPTEVLIDEEPRLIKASTSALSRDVEIAAEVAHRLVDLLCCEVIPVSDVLV